VSLKTGRIVGIVLLVIAGAFLALQLMQLAQGHDRSSGLYGIGSSLSVIAASLLNLRLIRQKQKQ
jgi:hypothetical protein